MLQSFRAGDYLRLLARPRSQLLPLFLTDRPPPAARPSPDSDFIKLPSQLHLHTSYHHPFLCFRIIPGAPGRPSPLPSTPPLGRSYPTAVLGLSQRYLLLVTTPTEFSRSSPKLPRRIFLNSTRSANPHGLPAAALRRRFKTPSMRQSRPSNPPLPGPPRRDLVKILSGRSRFGTFLFFVHCFPSQPPVTLWSYSLSTVSRPAPGSAFVFVLALERFNGTTAGHSPRSARLLAHLSISWHFRDTGEIYRIPLPTSV